MVTFSRNKIRILAELTLAQTSQDVTIAKCHEHKLSYTETQKSLMPIKVQPSYAFYRIGTVTAGGTHKGKKGKKQT